MTTPDDTDPCATVPMNLVELKKDIWVSISRFIPRRMAPLLGELRPCLIEEAERLILTLDLQLYSDKFASKTLTVRYPATWVQAFKERWAPAWWLRRWPVGYEAQTMTLTAHDVVANVKMPDAMRAGLVIIQGDITPGESA